MNEELKVQSLSNLLSKVFPRSEWLVEKLVPDSGLVLMSAAPASFKTWLALEMSLCVADGKPLFGIFPTKASGVLIADEESGDRMLQDRFKKLGAKIEDSPWNEKPIYYLSRIGRHIDDNYVKELMNECTSNNIKLVIFDSLVRFHNARENDASEMAKVLNLFKTLNDNGIATLVLHHNRKSGGSAGGGEMVRGSSDILAACDIHLSISRNKRKITISQTKNRYMEEIEPFSVQLNTLNDKRSEFEYIGKEDKDEQSNELRVITLRQIEETPGINKSELIRILSKNENGVSSNRIRVIIGDLINEKLIRTEQGVKNSSCLFINNVND